MSDLGIPLRNPEDVELEQVFNMPSEQRYSPSKFYVRGLTSYSTEAFMNPHHKSISNLPQLSHQEKARPKTSYNVEDVAKPLLPKLTMHGNNRKETVTSDAGVSDPKHHKSSRKSDLLSRETSKTSFKSEATIRPKKVGGKFIYAVDSV